MSAASPVARSEEIQAPFDAEPSRPRPAAMRRLPFRLADFTRIAWVSDPARETWEPRIRRIGQAWHEIEWRAVVAGVRSCSITSVSPEQLVQNAPRWAQQGLSALPLTMTGVTDCYAATSTAAQPGKPFSFRCVLGTPANVFRFKQAWDACDEGTIGNLLGYPACCREFYKRVWVDGALVDTTWPMAVATAAVGGAVDSASAFCLEGPLTPNPSPAWGEGSMDTPIPSPARGEGSMDTADPSPARGEGGIDNPDPSPVEGEGSMDTADPSPARGGGGRLIEVAGPPKANILWRWMGVRSVPHLPCSFHCAATVEFADRLLQVGRDLGFVQEMDWMLEILAWPVEWSALHGVAEIKTPVLKVSTRTDATPCKYTVRYQGQGLPAEAAQGLRFPFRTSMRPTVTASAAFRRGLEHMPESPLTPDPSPARGEGSKDAPNRPPAEDRGSASPSSAFSIQHSAYAADNGFSTVAAMDAAHEAILAAAGAVLAQQPGLVLDLGCGNGVLLKKLHAANAAVVPVGIDVDAGRIARARELLPAFAANFLASDIFDAEELWPAGRRYALALLMPGRLLEVPPERSAKVRARLREHCDRVLIYAYGDWHTRHGTLAGLAAAAGLKLLDGGENASAGLAEMAG